MLVALISSKRLKFANTRRLIAVLFASCYRISSKDYLLLSHLKIMKYYLIVDNIININMYFRNLIKRQMLMTERDFQLF